MAAFPGGTMANKFNKLLLVAALIAIGPVTARAEPECPQGMKLVAADTFLNSPGDTTSPMTGPLAQVPNSPMAVIDGSNEDVNIQVATVFARLHHVNMLEIEAGRLAWQKGQSKSVRNYGEQLMRDHQINDRRLMAFVAKNDILIDRVPATTAKQSAKDAEMTASLLRASATDFDRVFLQQMSVGHANTVNELTGAIDQMLNITARNFLSKMKPILVQHEKLGNILLEKNT
jgi:predicted outer membrane protein